MAILKQWDVVIVLGRPSSSITDFFNSIKFKKVIVEGATVAEAMMEEGAMVTPEDLSGGYEILNMYVFPSGEERNGGYQET